MFRSARGLRPRNRVPGEASEGAAEAPSDRTKQRALIGARPSRRWLGTKPGEGVIHQLGEMLRHLGPLPVILLDLGPEPAHFLSKPITVMLGGLHSVVQLLVLVAEAPQPLLLPLGCRHSLPEPVVIVEESGQHRQLSRAVLDPSPHLFPDLPGLGTDHDCLPFGARGPMCPPGCHSRPDEGWLSIGPKSR